VVDRVEGKWKPQRTDKRKPHANVEETGHQQSNKNKYQGRSDSFHRVKKGHQQTGTGL